MVKVLGRLTFVVIVTLLVPAYGFAQDEDTTPARLEDGAGRQIGRAEIESWPGLFGLQFRLFLDGGTKLRILYADESARRDAPAKFTFREFKVDPRNPKARDEATGTGIATIEPNQLDRDGNVASFSGSMQLTEKRVGEDRYVPTSEPVQRFKIVLQ